MCFSVDSSKSSSALGSTLPCGTLCGGRTVHRSHTIPRLPFSSLGPRPRRSPAQQDHLRPPLPPARPPPPLGDRTLASTGGGATLSTCPPPLAQGLFPGERAHLPWSFPPPSVLLFTPPCILQHASVDTSSRGTRRAVVWDPPPSEHTAREAIIEARASNAESNAWRASA